MDDSYRCELSFVFPLLSFTLSQILSDVQVLNRKKENRYVQPWRPIKSRKSGSSNSGNPEPDQSGKAALENSYKQFSATDSILAMILFHPEFPFFQLNEAIFERLWKMLRKMDSMYRTEHKTTGT
jgi:hypothetical protein